MFIVIVYDRRSTAGGDTIDIVEIPRKLYIFINSLELSVDIGLYEDCHRCANIIIMNVPENMTKIRIIATIRKHWENEKSINLMQHIVGRLS